MTSPDIFSTLEQSADRPAELLQKLVEHFRDNNQAMELFEARKMALRFRLGLPLLPSESDEPRDESVERELETGLLEACRETGELLIQQGRVFEGYTYLRPIGDNKLIAELVSKIPITDDNYEEMQRVLLHEGVDVGRGFQSILDHQGTCNSITLFDQAIVQRSKADRRAAGERLLIHFYDELSGLVRSDIASRDDAVTSEDELQGQSLQEMLSPRPWVLKDGGYHLDTTHLSSTVRIASTLEDPSLLRKAWELTQYGKQLHHQFQYPGEEPFVDFYPAYAAFYGVLLGEHQDAGLKLFERKAKMVDASEHGTGAIETYVDLLDRVGKHSEAIAFAVANVPDDVPSQTIMPLLVDIGDRAKAAGQTDALTMIRDYCRKHQDTIGFAVAAVTASDG